MEEQIKTQRKKLLISFSGCTKDDNGKRDKNHSTDRISIYKGTYSLSPFIFILPCWLLTALGQSGN
ncbi:hypothetical protein [Cardinium endosymbiont of Philonthus spinipes]|uniref:hypothetical protein n=1 Tax=Cardinium endosymbiont of Philonthus spinipes TaxID=3077941 RepID=UPI00313B436A